VAEVLTAAHEEIRGMYMLREEIAETAHPSAAAGAASAADASPRSKARSATGKRVIIFDFDLFSNFGGGQSTISG
jgi:hypothetical protein